MTSAAASPATRLGLRLLYAAAVVGLVHAAFSLYWAVGGEWLLSTVGQWTLDLRSSRPGLAALALIVIAAVKAAGAVLPLLATLNRVRWPRLWRGLAWAGAPVLVLYGGANTLVGTLVLAGAIRPDGGYDRQAMIGHTYLWDPLFLVWGVLLLGGLWITRDRWAKAWQARGRHGS